MRGYDEYLVSAYSEVLRHRPFKTFKEFFSIDEASDLSWVRVLKEMAVALPAAQFVVWDFETFRKSPRRVVAAIAGVPETVLDIVAPVSRASMSSRAIEHLASLGRTNNDEEIRMRARIAEKTFPRSEYGLFQPFSETEIKTLRDLHGKHLWQVRKSFSEGIILEEEIHKAGSSHQCQ